MIRCTSGIKAKLDVREKTVVQYEEILEKKMNTFVLVFLGACVAASLAAPQGNPQDAQAQVLKYDSDNAGIDGYNFNFETSNGISQQEQGTLQNAGSENEVMQVRGSFSYTGADGVVYTVTYIADENGFQPQGAHLPSK